MNASSEHPGEHPGSSRDPEQLERAAERLRADLDRTLDALERKLQPSQLLDRSLAYLREHGGEMAYAVGDSVRRHPVPVLLTVAGLGWLIVAAVRPREPVSITIGDEYPGEDDDDSPLDDEFLDDESLDDEALSAEAASRSLQPIRKELMIRFHRYYWRGGNHGWEGDFGKAVCRAVER